MTSTVPLKLGLKLMGAGFALSPRLRREIFDPATSFAFNLDIQITTRAGDEHVYLSFKDGKMRTGTGKLAKPGLVLVYRDKAILAKAIQYSPEDSLDMLLSGDLYYIGNLVALSKFSYLTTIIPRKVKRPVSPGFPSSTPISVEHARVKRVETIILNKQVDAVRYLPDPYLGEFSLEAFPSLVDMKDRLFSERPAICTERARNLTAFFREEGFELDASGAPWNPSLRQGLALKHVLATKEPRIFEGDMLPGSTTSKRLGVQLFPEFGATLIWPELHTVRSRRLNPYEIDAADIDTLNHDVFPFWIDRNIREHTRKKYGNPISQRFDDHFVLYFMWKTQAISHTIPDWSSLFEKGISGIIASVRNARARANGDPGKVAFHDGVIAALEGVLLHASRLREEALRQAAVATDPRRSAELMEMARVLSVVPASPATTFREAITATWIAWVALHQENMNAGLSLGRLDQVLYPYFERDMHGAGTPEAKARVLREVIELVFSFYMKCGDHLPLVPNVGNKLFGGSSSDQALTLGGMTRDGQDAVNDLTYIFLKVTEMACVRDPNVNARFNVSCNSNEYLARLCEVNINTTATPSLHNDEVMIRSLVQRGFAIDDARDWAATGCVEPTIVGKHFGHTNCMLLNLVAPLEVLMNDGHHPIIHYPVSEGLTPPFSSERYRTFDEVLAGYKAQLAFLIEKSVEINNMLGTAHQATHPTPLLSALIQGTVEAGRDVVDGGATYNSSGVALVALVDVIDSLLALKMVVFEWKKATLEQFKQAIDRNYSAPHDKVILEHVKRVPKFGSDDPGSNALAADLVAFMDETYGKARNYRGGRYMVGFWSMSNHTAFGKLSGALPSGRLAGKAFTPGITPSPGSSDQLLDNIKTVARIDGNRTPNNIAFNVKLVPGPGDAHAVSVDRFAAYAKSYFDLGGMQMQFNVVTSGMLRDAMKHPEQYRWLMVRISGYNAYFIELNEDMQRELIERMEFRA